MTPPDATTLLQAELITRQQHEIAELRRENEQLNSSMAKLSKILSIALNTNVDGNTLTCYRKAQK